MVAVSKKSSRDSRNPASGARPVNLFGPLNADEERQTPELGKLPRRLERNEREARMPMAIFPHDKVG